MGSLFEKCFGNDVPENRRMFYIASLTSGGAALFLLLFNLLLGTELRIVVACFGMFVVSASLFHFEVRCGKTLLNTLILLFIFYVVGFPLLFVFSDINTVEVPIYYLVGITYSLVLLKGKPRAASFLIQMGVDIASIVYCFSIRVQIHPYGGPSTVSDYLRIELAIIIAGVLCGSLLFYRNTLILNEMKLREAATEQAQKVSYAKDMFLVNVSHEIRTPLNAIIGTTEVVLDFQDTSDRIRDMAYNISNSSRALLAITSDLLDFSRMNEDYYQTSSEKYDISSLLNDIINLFSVRLLDSNVEFYVDISPNIPKILIGDSTRIRQILINMLSNAVKYTKNGFVSLELLYEWQDKDHIKLEFLIKDTGIGIKPENIEKIFEAYNRSGNETTDRLIEGNGLGLALCKRLSNAMGGEIWAESVFGEGSTFHFKCSQQVSVPYIGGYCGGITTEVDTIAYYTAEDSEMDKVGAILDKMEVLSKRLANEAELFEAFESSGYEYYFISSDTYESIKGRLGGANFDWGKLVVISPCNYSCSGEPIKYLLNKPVSCLNIADLLNHHTNYNVRRMTYSGDFKIPNAVVLVVDDNLVNLDVAANIIGRYGCKVITAASGKEGIIAIGQEHIDIVFLDYMMPDMDGIDTLKAIRAMDDEMTDTLPIVALTANVVSGAREMFLNEGFDDYLSKPIEVEKLEKALIEHLPSELLEITV